MNRRDIAKLAAVLCLGTCAAVPAAGLAQDTTGGATYGQPAPTGGSQPTAPAPTEPRKRSVRPRRIPRWGPAVPVAGAAVGAVPPLGGCVP